MNKTISMIIAIILIGGSFYGGMKYAGAKNPTTNMANAFSARQVRSGQRGISMGGFTSGDVIAKDATTITVKLQDGGSKIIIISTSTPVIKSLTGSLQDVVVGTKISVTGPANQDGSISANSIRIGDFAPQIRQSP